jgi:hypothetical protein
VDLCSADLSALHVDSDGREITKPVSAFQRLKSAATLTLEPSEELPVFSAPSATCPFLTKESIL